jgi:hypothetical protein
MPRTLLAVASAVACALLMLAPGAGAKTPAKTCTATSAKVMGKTIDGTLSSSNVNSVQARFATCAHAKKVMERVTELGLEEPRPVKAFYCVPTVKSTGPDLVAYRCTFKGADTPMFVKLTFQVTYKEFSAY